MKWEAHEESYKAYVIPYYNIPVEKNILCT